MRLALYQPDIPQNAGAMMRLAACLGIAVDIIEPCGFVMTDRQLRRAGMDYLVHVELRRHVSWEAYYAEPKGRLVLLTTAAATRHTAFAYLPEDTLLVGRESAGVPPDVHNAVDAAVRVAMRPPMRSLNVATAAAMVLGEAMRQCDCYPPEVQR